MTKNYWNNLNLDIKKKKKTMFWSLNSYPLYIFIYLTHSLRKLKPNKNIAIFSPLDKDHVSATRRHVLGPLQNRLQKMAEVI